MGLRLLFGTAVLALGCAATKQSDAPRAKPRWDDVAAHWRGTRAYVDVLINGVPESLLLDTGSDVTILSPDLVSRVGVPTFDAELPLETSRGWTEPGQHTCARVDLRLGQLRQDADVLVLPLDGVSRVFGEPQAGILGFHMWAGVCLRIDYPGREIRASPDPLPMPDGLTVFPTQQGQARMRLDLPAGKSAIVVIDTGSNACLVLPETLEGDLHFKVRPRVTGYVSTLAGRAERRTGRLDGAVRIGRYTINDPLVALGSGSVGVMGRGLLEDFTVTFDMARSRVALSREGDTVDIPSLRGIGAGIEKGREGWVVTHVLPGGPAENAGLRAGDRIVALNGTIEDLRARLDALGNTAEAVTFEVDRGGSRKRLEIPVEVLVE